MSRKRKVLLGVAALVALIAAYLFAFALISTSHPISKAAIAQSPNVARSVGKLAGVLLIGNRQKLVPGGFSCSKNTYLAFGDAGWAVVVSELSMQAPQADWNVDSLSVGWFSRTHGRC
jgi:hypothetical protein